MIEEIKKQVGSNNKEGWPVVVRDRIGFPKLDELRVTSANFGITFLWTMRDSIIPYVEKGNLAIATNFYTPSGIGGMIRNILSNPFIRYIILLGEEYSSRSKKDTSVELTSANAIRTFFEKGFDENRRLIGFENAVYLDKNIPLELVEKIRENVKLIDLNKEMTYSSLPEKIEEANRIMRTTEKMPAFLERPQIFPYEKSKDSFPYEGGPLIIHGTTIPNAWIKMIHNINRYGRKNLMNANTDRWVKEINNMVVVVHDPQNMDLSVNPFLIPLTPEKIRAYQEEILSPLLPEGKAYTYGNKLRAYYSNSDKEIKNLVNSTEYKDFEFGQGPWIDENVSYKENHCEINQIKDLIEVLRKDPYSKACVAITWHPADELMRKHKSSPCLVLLQALVQDEKLNLFVFFRSHDMTQGWPENAYGCAAIQKEIAKGIGVEPGILTIISGSAQIYNNYYSQVESMLEEHSISEKTFSDPRGNYLVKIEDNEIVLTLVHPQTGEDLESFRGKTANEMRDKVMKNIQVNSEHAIYIGTEIMKAEIALKKNLFYEQDKDIELENKQPTIKTVSEFPVFKEIDFPTNVSVINESNLGERPSWDEYFMKMAIHASSRSTCFNVHSGSVIVMDNQVISTGYNGAARGIKSSLERGGCFKESVTGKSYAETLNTGTCIGVHSEMNALAHLSKLIHKDATLYTTVFPCPSCAKNLLSYGVKRVVFKRSYDRGEMIMASRFFEEGGVKVEQLDLSPQRAWDIDFNRPDSKFDVWSEEEKRIIREKII